MREFKDLLHATRASMHRVARQNQRAGACVDGIFDVISELQGAAQRSDWQEVRRLAELILMDSFVYGAEGSEEDIAKIEHGMETHFADGSEPASAPIPSSINLQLPRRRPFRKNCR